MRVLHTMVGCDSVLSVAVVDQQGTLNQPICTSTSCAPCAAGHQLCHDALRQHCTDNHSTVACLALLEATRWHQAAIPGLASALVSVLWAQPSNLQLTVRVRRVLHELLTSPVAAGPLAARVAPTDTKDNQTVSPEALVVSLGGWWYWSHIEKVLWMGLQDQQSLLHAFSSIPALKQRFLSVIRLQLFAHIYQLCVGPTLVSTSIIK